MQLCAQTAVEMKGHSCGWAVKKAHRKFSQEACDRRKEATMRWDGGYGGAKGDDSINHRTDSEWAAGDKIKGDGRTDPLYVKTSGCLVGGGSRVCKSMRREWSGGIKVWSRERFYGVCCEREKRTSRDKAEQRKSRCKEIVSNYLEKAATPARARV